MPREFTERLQSIEADIKALRDDTRDASIPASLQARLDSISNELAAITFDLNRTTVKEAPAEEAKAKFRFQIEEEVRLQTSELKTARESLQAILDSSLYVIQVFQAVRNEAGNIVDFVWTMNNRRGIEQNGDVIGKSLLKQNPGVIPSGLFDKFIEVTETGVSFNQEQYYNYEQFNGWFRQTLVRVGDGFVMNTEEITKQKNAEQEILRLKDELAQTVEAKFRTLFNSIDEGFCLIEVLFDEQDKPVDYRFLEVNSAFERQTGIQNSVGRRIREFVPHHEEHWFEIYGQVAVTGEPIRFENRADQLHRYYDVYAFRVGQPSARQVAVLFNDITERKQREQQQAFLLKLSDTLRPLTDAVEMKAASNRLLGEYLRTDRAYYVELDRVHGLAILERDYVRGDEPSLSGAHPIAAFEATLANHRSGRPTVCDDALIDPKIREADRPAYLERRLRSFITTPLIKNGEFMGAMSVTNSKPRTWEPHEVALVVEVSERTWDAVQRARAEAAEREQRMLAEGLRDTAIALSRTLNMEEVLEAALVSAQRIVPCDTGLIVLAEKGSVTELHSMGMDSKEQNTLERWHRKKSNLDATALYRPAASTREPVLLPGEQLRSMRLPAAFGSQVMIVPLLHQNGILGYLTLISRETSRFSEKDRLKLQALAYQVVIAVQSAIRFRQAQELVVLQERNMIARELHDSVSQALFSASIMTEAMVKLMTHRDPEETTKMLTTLNRVVQSAMAEMRTLLLELRPTHVYSTPFTQLLRQLTQAALGRKYIEADFTFEGEPSLPEDVHFALYRVAQEAVNNIIKHASATHMSISGKGGQNYIDLRIHDDGSGFDTDDPSSGMGMSNMQERAAEVHAQLTVHSIVGDGTEIQVVWPKGG